jgi:hypothetical protein
MKRYLLYLTNAKLPDEWPKELTHIILKDGVNQRDFDVEECDIPKDVYQKWINMFPRNPESDNTPIGADFSGTPVGAVLTVLGSDEK